MLGTGRSMLILVKNMKKHLPPVTKEQLEERLDPTELRLVSFSLTSMSPSFISHHTKDFHDADHRKTYGMVIKFSRPVVVPIANSKQLFNFAVQRYPPPVDPMISEPTAVTNAFSIQQLTPVRVLHRRAMMARSRRLWQLDLIALPGSDLIFCCRLETDPGELFYML